MAEPTQLDILRGQHKAVLEYERNRTERRGPRNERGLRPQLETLGRHLAQWDQVARAAGSDEESPLLPLCHEWQATLGIQEPSAETDQSAKQTASKPKGKGKGKGKGKTKKAATPKPPTETKAPTENSDDGAQDNPEGAGDQDSGTAPADPVGEGNGSEAPGEDDATYKILGKGDWLATHAKIIREQIPKVKSAAADPAKYEKAKKDFLKRNLPALTAYGKEPKKGHSPLFAYCVMYLSDIGMVGDAIALAETAVELRQTSPIKRNYHELLFDVRLAQFEREAPEVCKAGPGPLLDAFMALRVQLMADPFRGNHAKAKVCKTFATVCMALGDYEPARQNLQQVKFLDPNMGVETLLAQCDAKLSG